MLIAGDIGGTKTNLALFDATGSSYDYHHLSTFSSKAAPDLESIAAQFIESCRPFCDPKKIQTACFAIAGPITEGVCRATNLPWVIDAKALAKELNLKKVYLINDLEGNAWALDILPKGSLESLYRGKGLKGNRAVVSPGTGLGEAGLYWDGKQHHPFSSEGGHCEFGPRTEVQIALSRYLCSHFGHPSYERVLSGPGLVNIYNFYRDEMKKEQPQWLKKEFDSKEEAQVITEQALNGKSEICVESLNLFVSILGSEASNCALKYMALGGIFLGGGIPPKILPKLKESSFLDGFFDKGRFRSLLEQISIDVILDDKASLRGAAHYCRAKDQA